MNIAVLSGKGGTGKTLLSVNMAAVADNSIYIDCDVEEPNGHLFFKPKDVEIEEITIKTPKVKDKLCDGCRQCIEFCKFNALAYINEKVIVFEDVCHSCGGCALVCPQGAISEVDKGIGKIEKGISDKVSVNTGILNIGVAAGIPIIDRLLDINKEKPDGRISLIDCPPGSACSVMESIRDADYCILVAEPTVFGAHNLHMVYELVTLFNKPFGLVINKCIDEDNLIDDFCRQRHIKVLERIYYNEELGKLNSDGKIAARESSKYNKMFAGLLEKVVREVQDERTSDIKR